MINTVKSRIQTNSGNETVKTVTLTTTRCPIERQLVSSAIRGRFKMTMVLPTAYSRSQVKNGTRTLATRIDTMSLYKVQSRQIAIRYRQQVQMTRMPRCGSPIVVVRRPPIAVPGCMLMPKRSIATKRQVLQQMSVMTKITLTFRLNSALINSALIMIFMPSVTHSTPQIQWVARFAMVELQEPTMASFELLVKQTMVSRTGNTGQLRKKTTKTPFKAVIAMATIVVVQGPQPLNSQLFRQPLNTTFTESKKTIKFVIATDPPKHLRIQTAANG